MSRAQDPKLEMLALELQLAIAEYLDYGSLLALRRTSRRFREVANQTTCSEAEKVTFVAAAEQYPRNADGFGCFRCHRVLSACKFADKQKRKAYGKGGSRSLLRFCVECGVKKHIYAPGNWVVRDGVAQIYCRRCLRIREG